MARAWFDLNRPFGDCTFKMTSPYIHRQLPGGGGITKLVGLLQYKIKQVKRCNPTGPSVTGSLNNKREALVYQQISETNVSLANVSGPTHQRVMMSAV